MNAHSSHFSPGEVVTISRAAYPKQSQYEEHCSPLEVVRTTQKAVLVKEGADELWIPLAALTPSSNRTGFYLLARWVNLPIEWRYRVGDPQS